MATMAQVSKIEQLVERLNKHGMANRLTIEQRRRLDTMHSHLLKAKEADEDIAAQEIAHAQAIFGR